jgi:hypothetical protein
MTKHKTNRQVLANAIKQMSDIDLVFLRERMLTITENVINNQEQIKKDMKNGIVHPDLYIESMKRINELIDFK